MRDDRHSVRVLGVLRCGAHLLRQAAVVIAGPALAQDGPRLSGSGDNAVVEYRGQAPGSVVGGGSVTMTGSDDDTSFTHGRVAAQPGRLTGSGVNAEVTYAPAARVAQGFAGARSAQRGG